MQETSEQSSSHTLILWGQTDKQLQIKQAEWQEKMCGSERMHQSWFTELITLQKHVSANV